MEKRLEVIWTQKALERLGEIYLYLLLKWSETIADKFEAKVTTRVNRLSKQPYMGTGSEKKLGLRKVLITEHNYMLYRILNEQLIILDFIDTRQEPATNDKDDE
jgi:plasmid stabilization system protein ParE